MVEEIRNIESRLDELDEKNYELDEKFDEWEKKHKYVITRNPDGTIEFHEPEKKKIAQDK